MQLSSSLPFIYQRRQPEQSVLYEIVEQYYSEFTEHLSSEGKSLPLHVQKEFEAFLRCGRLEHGFLRVGCNSCRHELLVPFSCKKRGFCPSCGASRMAESAALLVDDILPERPHRQWVLSLPIPLRFLVAKNPGLLSEILKITYQEVSGYLIRKAGQKRSSAQTGAVTYIQFFGGALNLNPHYHLIVLDGVFLTNSNSVNPIFKQVVKPSSAELQQVIDNISLKVAKRLEKLGYIERDMDNCYLALDEQSDLDQCNGYSTTYRIAVGPNKGKKVFTLQTLPARPEEFDERSDYCVTQGGFSLHAGVATKAHQKPKLERICRYMARPAVSGNRLSILSNGNIRLQLKSPYRDGTTHLIFEPLDFISKLASLIPPPRMHLTRYHGLYAPNSKYRGVITPSKRGKGGKATTDGYADQEDNGSVRKRMTWAQRLKRVFGIDIETCGSCGGQLKVIACIEDQATIASILDHLNKKEEKTIAPEPRAPPIENMMIQVALL